AGAAAGQVAIRRAHGERPGDHVHGRHHMGLQVQVAAQVAGVRRARGAGRRPPAPGLRLPDAAGSGAVRPVSNGDLVTVPRRAGRHGAQPDRRGGVRGHATVEAPAHPAGRELGADEPKPCVALEVERCRRCAAQGLHRVGAVPAARAAQHRPVLLARLGEQAMSPELAYRAVVLLLWALVAVHSWVCRGLFWDGASFLAIVLDTRTFHDFYPARAHVAWVTQAPVLLLIKAGVSDTRLLSIVYSATLFAVPTAIYQVALRRVRGDAVLLGVVLAIIAVVYLPTWFFIIGEFNTTYAAATWAMAILLTDRDFSRRGAAILFGL